MNRYTKTKLEAIYDSVPGCIDRVVERVILKYEAPQIKIKVITQKERQRRDRIGMDQCFNWMAQRNPNSSYALSAMENAYNERNCERFGLLGADVFGGFMNVFKR